ASSRAVLPETVKHAITVAPVSCAARQAMAQVVSGKEAGIFAGSGVSQGWLRAEDSAARTIRSIISTDRTGDFPEAVSPESISASGPSKTALATSEASARVGRG